jgi:N-acetylglucosaminyldiphosphoundecaprenol N-acetyl-beta-D-mannosaminyltransferase
MRQDDSTLDLQSFYSQMAQEKIVGIGTIPLSLYSDTEVLREIEVSVTTRQLLRICPLNYNNINHARIDNNYAQYLKQYDILQPDGIAIRTAARLFSNGRVDFSGFSHGGTDFYPKVLAMAERNHSKVFFLGDTTKTLDKLLRYIHEKYPVLEISGMHHGYFSFSDLDVVRTVQNSGADILMVGMGVPRQDEWIMTYFHQYNVPVSIAVGAGLAYLSGAKMRAPLIVRGMVLEDGIGTKTDVAAIHSWISFLRVPCLQIEIIQ